MKIRFVADEVELLLIALRLVGAFDYGLNYFHPNVLTVRVFIFWILHNLDLKPHGTVHSVLPTLKMRTIDSVVVFK